MRACDNPFATVRVHRIRYRLAGLTWNDLLERLGRIHYRGAIVGPEGAGKTTLLEDFEPRLRERGFEIVSLRLTRETPNFSPATLRALSAGLTPRHIILFDGAEQLGRWSWWRFLRRTRRAGGIIITSHRSGLLPTLLECQTTPELLAGIVADLLGAASTVNGAQTNRLFRKHRGNLREALREMYDLVSVQPAAGADALLHHERIRVTSSTESPPPRADRRRDRTGFCQPSE